MSGYPGHYSLIQYCPDPSRAEAANVGVLLFCPPLNFIKARTAGGNDRIRRFFRGQAMDLQQINVMKRSIERRLRVEADRFRTFEDLQNFVESRANDIVLTAPRPMKVFVPKADLDQLFAELVGGRMRGERVTTLIPELDQPMKALEHEGLVWTPPRVMVPILGTSLKAPYAYRNGAVNLVKPLIAPAEDDVRRKAGQLALEGDLLQKHADQLDRPYQLVVVSGSKTEAALRAEDLIAPLFLDYHVKFVRRAEIPAFVDQVRREAHA